MGNNSSINKAFDGIRSELHQVSIKDIDKIRKHLEALYDAARLDGRMAAVKEFCYPKG